MKRKFTIIRVEVTYRGQIPSFYLVEEGGGTSNTGQRAPAADTIYPSQGNKVNQIK